MDKDLDPGSLLDIFLKSIVRLAIAYSNIIGPSTILLFKSIANLIIDNYLPVSILIIPYITPIV